MAIIYLLINAFAYQGEVMLVRRYGKKYGAGGFLFNGVICLFAMIFFIVSDKGGFYFPKGLWVYGIINAVLYAAGFYYAFVAYRLGNYLITHTIAGMSFVFPIFYGLFFLGERQNYMTYLALTCTFTSFFLSLYNRYRKEKSKKNATEKKTLSFAWLVATLITLVSNGFISIVAKMQQAKLGTGINNEYMIITLSGATLFLLVIGFVKERKDLRRTFIQGGAYGAAAGLLNGIKNGANLASIALLPLSLLTPLRTAIKTPLNILVGIFIYKEKYTPLQYVSIGLGILAGILMQAAKYV